MRRILNLFVFFNDNVNKHIFRTILVKNASNSFGGMHVNGSDHSCGDERLAAEKTILPNRGSSN